MKDRKQNDGPEYHEDEDGIEKDNLEITIVVDNCEGNPVVTDDSVVNEHYSNQKSRTGESKSGQVNDSDLDLVEGSFEGLDCQRQGGDVDFSDM